MPSLGVHSLWFTHLRILVSSIRNRYIRVFTKFGIELLWRLQFLEYLRTLHLKFQKARIQIEVVLSLPGWLSQLFRSESSEILNLGSPNKPETVAFTIPWYLDVWKILNPLVIMLHPVILSYPPRSVTIENIAAFQVLKLLCLPILPKGEMLCTNCPCFKRDC